MSLVKGSLSQARTGSGLQITSTLTSIERGISVPLVAFLRSSGGEEGRMWKYQDTREMATRHGPGG